MDRQRVTLSAALEASEDGMAVVTVPARPPALRQAVLREIQVDLDVARKRWPGLRVTTRSGREVGLDPLCVVYLIEAEPE